MACNSGQGHFMANHRRGLQQALGLRGQPVNAGSEHGLHRRGHLNGRERLFETIGARLADQHSGLHQRAHTLFQEEGIALRAREQERRERRQAGVVSEQRLQDFLGAGRRQRVQAQVRVVRLTAPAVLVLRPIVDQEQEPGGRQALDQAVEQGLRLGVDPVQILEDQEQWLLLALAQEHALEGLERALAPLRRIERAGTGCPLAGRRGGPAMPGWHPGGRHPGSAPARSAWPGWCGCHRGLRYDSSA